MNDYGINLIYNLGRLTFLYHMHKFDGHFSTENFVNAINKIMSGNECERSIILKNIINDIERNKNCKCKKEMSLVAEHNTSCQCSKKH